MIFYSFHRYFVSSPGQDRFYSMHDMRDVSSDVMDAFKKFRQLKQELKVRGYYEAETPFHRTKPPPYLYTWFQTSEAMVMLLSNQTFQVNIDTTNIFH